MKEFLITLKEVSEEITPDTKKQEERKRDHKPFCLSRRG